MAAVHAFMMNLICLTVSVTMQSGCPTLEGTLARKTSEARICHICFLFVEDKNTEPVGRATTLRSTKIQEWPNKYQIRVPSRPVPAGEHADCFG